MNILFVHQNFPGQFKHLAPALASDPANRVAALHANMPPPSPNVETLRVEISRGNTPGLHPWTSDFETKLIRGEATYRAGKTLKAAGFTPDVIIAHPGWGESLFLEDLWPSARQGLYCEFFYRSEGADVNFDPEFGREEDAAPRLRVRNAVFNLQLPYMRGGISPTLWQQSTFPEQYRPAISVIHDGIDTTLVAPAPGFGLDLRKGERRLVLQPDQEIITFIVRNLEPYRGYHIFMRALPEILRARPKAQVLIVGGDDVSYGPRPPNRPNQPQSRGWKDIFLQEVIGQLDLSRVHFLGRVPYNHYLAIIQLSKVHVYLTYPFVLSWSLLEAMSAGCAIVASDTAPVREAIFHSETGLLVDFFSTEQLAESVCRLCDDPIERERLGRAARGRAIEKYDLKKICLPAQIDWVRRVAG